MYSYRYGLKFLKHLRSLPSPSESQRKWLKISSYTRDVQQLRYCSAASKGKPQFDPVEEPEENIGLEQGKTAKQKDEINNKKTYREKQQKQSWSSQGTQGFNQQQPLQQQQEDDETVRQHDHQQQQQQQQQNNHKSNKKQQPKRSSLPSIKNPFEAASEKTKDSYLMMVEIFSERDVHRRNHVEFIYAALKHMADYGVEHDLEVYKALVNVMPKGKFIPTNMFQAEFMHYPKQQQCIIDLLEQMEDLGVMPDLEMEQMLLNIFGRKGHPLRKFWRMMYWMPKFKNLSPWPLPNPMPDLALEIAMLAVERMCSVDVRSTVTVFETKDVEEAIDKTWIVSGMSGEQAELLRNHPRDKALYIEGPFLIWLRNRSINYFTLRADPNEEVLNSFREAEYVDEDDVSGLKVPSFGPPSPRRSAVGKVRSVHQQDDGTIFAICASGTSTKDSLLSWIRLLVANGNPALGEIPVLFRFTSDMPARAVEIEGGDELSIKPHTKSNESDAR